MSQSQWKHQRRGAIIVRLIPVFPHRSSTVRLFKDTHTFASVAWSLCGHPDSSIFRCDPTTDTEQTHYTNTFRRSCFRSHDSLTRATVTVSEEQLNDTDESGVNMSVIPVMSCEWFSWKFCIFQGSVLLLTCLYTEVFLILQEMNGENISERRQQHFSCPLFSSCHDEGNSRLMISRKQMLLISDLMSQSNMASALVLRGVL